MRILLIAPSSGPWRLIGRYRLFNGRTFRFSLLSLLSVAAETPSWAQVRIVDEQLESIPWDADVDLVGITCMTALAPRAYEIAEVFRQRGIPVVLGGMHPSFQPEEALRHADAVVVGEAEGVWERVVEAAATGSLSGIYKASEPVDLANLKPLPRHLLRGPGYATMQAVQATRGCPHQCSFCSVSAFHGGRFRKRPVADVVAEVSELPERFFIFVDDNLTAEREYARELFEALIPLRKRWMTQSTLAIAEDTELVELASQAGCMGIFAGLETFSEGNLAAMEKSFNQASTYRERVAYLHSRGIGIEAGIVFGFDGDRPDVFSRTLNLLDDLRIDLVQVSIYTPLPVGSTCPAPGKDADSTPAIRHFESMRDRILDWNWSHYDFHHAVFQPKGMSTEALQAGHDWVTREFYLPWRIARRLAWRATWPHGIETLPYAAAMNLAYYGRVTRFGIRGWNPSAAGMEPAPWFPPLLPHRGGKILSPNTQPHTLSTR